MYVGNFHRHAYTTVVCFTPNYRYVSWGLCVVVCRYLLIFEGPNSVSRARTNPRSICLQHIITFVTITEHAPSLYCYYISTRIHSNRCTAHQPSPHTADTAHRSPEHRTTTLKFPTSSPLADLSMPHGGRRTAARIHGLDDSAVISMRLR